MKKESVMLPLKKAYSDDFQTPSEVLDYLIPWLQRDWTIWECAMGKGNLVKALRESKDWWLVRDCGLKVLCSECTQKWKDRMKDEVSGDVMLLV
jgi:hypothetical protein